MAKKILIVEDEKNIVDILTFMLKKEGYDTVEAYDGEQGLDLALRENPDLVLLDIMLPRIDGFTVCRRIRQSSMVPIMMLTAREEEVDKVLGLELGADDYITKPFGQRELLARIKANLRRTAPEEHIGIANNSGSKNSQGSYGNQSVQDNQGDQKSHSGQYNQSGQHRSASALIYGDLVIDPERYEVKREGKTIELTLREFELVKFLAAHQGQIFSRESLLSKVWGYEYYGDVRTVDVTVRRIRMKLEKDPENEVYLLTKRGVGYYFNDDLKVG